MNKIYSRGSALPMLILGVVLLGAVLVGGYFFLASQTKSSATTQTQPPAGGLAVTVPGDIYRDGKVTQASVDLVKAHLGCVKTDPCWNKVIAKTHDGDNPIYTSDLDSNNDGVIDEKDIPVVK